MTPRMQIVWQVLEAAQDARDQAVIGACRRIIAADRIGWRKHGDPTDLRLVMEIASEVAHLTAPRPDAPRHRA